MGKDRLSLRGESEEISALIATLKEEREACWGRVGELHGLLREWLKYCGGEPLWMPVLSFLTDISEQREARMRHFFETRKLEFKFDYKSKDDISEKISCDMQHMLRKIGKLGAMLIVAEEKQKKVSEPKGFHLRAGDNQLEE